MTRQSVTRWLATFVVAIVAAGCQTKAKFQERCSHINTVAVLPPQVRTGTMTIGGKLREPFKQQNSIEAQFLESIVREFRSVGFTVKDCSLRREAGCTNSLWDVQATALLTNAYASRMARSIRPEGMELATHLQADGLIFVNILAYHSTDGRKALAGFGNFLSLLGAVGGHPGPWTPFSQMIVEIVFVDGSTGDVLWRTARDFHDIDRSSGDQIAVELMKKFPTR